MRSLMMALIALTSLAFATAPAAMADENKPATATAGKADAGNKPEHREMKKEKRHHVKHKHHMKKHEKKPEKKEKTMKGEEGK